MRAAHRRFEPVDFRRVGRHEDRGFDACGGAISRHRARRVARRWSGDTRDAELFGARERRRHPTRLEGAGRVQPLLLDVEAIESVSATESRRAQERRHPLAQRDDIRLVAHRHQLAIAPHRPCAVVQIARRQSLRCAEVVASEEHFSAVGADRVEVVGAQSPSARGAFEMIEQTLHVPVAPSSIELVPNLCAAL